MPGQASAGTSESRSKREPEQADAAPEPARGGTAATDIAGHSTDSRTDNQTDSRTSHNTSHSTDSRTVVC